MKKNLFFFAAAAIALASCSNDDVVDVNNGSGIDFRASVGSRASETKTDNLTAFNVTAINGSDTYFQDVTFTGETKDGTTIYKSAADYYWPAGTLNFYAYAPTDMTKPALTESKNGLTFANFAPSALISKQIDFITATATGSKSGETNNETTGVALAFSHNLAQIEIQAKNENSAYVYSVKGVRIGQVVKSGTFTLGTTPAWTLGADKTNYGVILNDPITLNATAEPIMAKNNDNTVSTAMIVPQTLTAWNPETENDNGTYIAVLVNIKSSTGGQVFPNDADKYAWVAVAVDGKWEAGNKYTYTLNFSKGAGLVAPEQGGGNGENPGDGGEGDGGNGDNVVDPEPVDEGVKPGDNILGGPITFTATVKSWEKSSNSPVNKDMQ